MDKLNQPRQWRVWEIYSIIAGGILTTITILIIGANILFAYSDTENRSKENTKDILIINDKLGNHKNDIIAHPQKFENYKEFVTKDELKEYKELWLRQYESIDKKLNIILEKSK